MADPIIDHGTFPIERLRTDRNGAWLGSASHDNILKMTDVRDALVDSDEEDSEKEGSDDLDAEEETGELDEDSDSSSATNDKGKLREDENEESTNSDESGPTTDQPEAHVSQPNSDSELDQQLELAPSKKRKRKPHPGVPESKKGKVDTGFFDGL
ncbi:hypothetical protein BN14_05030 [Rhizoctonia solani AG-1 IB]|uniref:Uncharacterized protein n=1 Tax=Thanatephorus cucumeris (strain AG1-IB / isolate 7/3/14) TaxID=1108050 RepID=M5BUT3_THACB|nr:hypothetical protein BN14_05030 [Rhizoctonia solani AG-1 IB]